MVKRSLQDVQSDQRERGKCFVLDSRRAETKAQIEYSFFRVGQIEVKWFEPVIAHTSRQLHHWLVKTVDLI